MDRNRGFTWVQLRVGAIIAVIAILVVVIMTPLLLDRPRGKKEHGSKCMANLGGISKSLAMYMAENQGLVPYAPGNILKTLETYGVKGPILECPSAEPGAVSYGFNGWLYGAETSGAAPVPPGGQSFVFPLTRDNALIPAFADAREIEGWPLETDAKPTEAEFGGKPLTPTGGHMKRFAISRHGQSGQSVNVGFLDHAETVKLPALWKLKWHAAWKNSPTAPTAIP